MQHKALTFVQSRTETSFTSRNAKHPRSLRNAFRYLAHRHEVHAPDHLKPELSLQRKGWDFMPSGARLLLAGRARSPMPCKLDGVRVGLEVGRAVR